MVSSVCVCGCVSWCARVFVRVSVRFTKGAHARGKKKERKEDATCNQDAHFSGGKKKATLDVLPPMK